LCQEYGLEGVTVSTYQAVSGAGIVALDAFLADSQRGYEQPDRMGLGVSAQCCRVAVAVGHYENVWVSCARPIDLKAIAALFSEPSRSPFLRFLPGAAGDGLSAVSSVQDRDNALVGRLRRDPRDASQRTLCLTVVGDNLRLGTATNAIRIASRWYPVQDPALQG
jgi:aspartate-semialdehyde dehydrogenase